MQRSFAQKLSRQSASEVRKQISSTKTNQELLPNINLNQSVPSLVSLWEIADPVDFEEYISQNIAAYDRDPLRKYLEFPPDDIELKVIPRKCRTVSSLLPDADSESEPRIQYCLEAYTSDWIVVNRKYQHSLYRNKDLEYSPSLKQEFEIDYDDDSKSVFENESTIEFDSDKDSVSSGRSSFYTNETPRGSWSSSVFDLRNSLSDPIITGLLDKVSVESMDNQNELKRQESRTNTMFTYFPNLNLLDDNIECRSPAYCPTEHIGHRILVECVQLKLELEIEPIFASMALYDAREKKKISENFYFDMNPDSLKHMLNQHIVTHDISSLSRSCVFNITYPSPDIYLVIKLEKVLQGDINECAEPYIKEDKVNKEKIKSNAVIYCERLGKYRMPFAWTAVDLNTICEKNDASEKELPSSNSLERKLSSASFDQLRKKLPGDSGSLSRKGSLERKEKRRSWSPEDFHNNLDSFEPKTIKIASFFKQEADKLRDEDLYKFLPELKKPSSISKKLKCIPGMLKLDFLPCPEGLKYCLTPELEKVIPYPDAKKRPIKEILEFPLKDVYFPHYVFRNLLYLYIKDLNFTNRAGSSRNITVKVQFMGGEEEHHALPVIMGKSSCPEFTSYTHTTVSYHNKTPDFYDEIKIKLPSVLEYHHHLFFTFYHISCQRKVEQTPIETPIGYTWLPLIQNGQLKAGNFQLPVMLDPPPPNYSYISPETALPGTRWIDNHKGLFTISLEAISSVHTQDNCLEDFLNICEMIDKGKVSPHIGENNIEPELKARIMKLTESSLEKLVKFLPLILNKLISLLMKPPIYLGHNINIGQVCFEAIGSIVKSIVNNLESYNDHHRRNSLLTTFIQFQSKFPHLPYGDQNLSSTNTQRRDCNSSQSTLGKHYSRSTSNPDLTGTLSQMDYEITSILTRGIDRTASMRTGNEASHYYICKSSNRKTFHEELALQWVVSSGNAKEAANSNSWFFFELMFKSMVEYLAVSQKINAPRKTRFSEQFCDDITNLVTSMTSEITSHFTRDNKESLMINNLNCNLAFFLSDLLSIMDRTYVLSLVKTYCKEITMKMNYVTDSSLIYHLKLDFMKIISNHEHFVTLNLPFGTPLSCNSTCVSPSPSVGSGNSQSSFVSTLMPIEKWNFAELSYEYRHQHFLLGLIMGDLASVMDLNHPSLHLKAVNVIRLLLSSHDFNVNQQSFIVKSRIALLYLPLIGIILECLPQLYDWSLEGKGRLVTNQEEDKNQLHQSVALAIAGTSMFGTQENLSEHSGSSQNPAKHPLSSQTTRTLLVCFLWVIKNVDKLILRNWWSDLPPQRLHQLLEVLYICVSAFEYKGRKICKKVNPQTLRKPADIKMKLQDIILGGQGSARNEMMMRRKVDKNPPSPSVHGEKLRWRKDFTQWRHLYDFSDRTNTDSDFEPPLDSNLAAEANMVILDALEIIIHVSSQSDNLHGLLGPTLKVLLHALGCNQSTVVLQNMFASQRMMVYRFPSLLFDEETEQCGDLCLRLLKHCSSSISCVRSQASASLYMLMRQNFEIGNNFSKVKMQVTTSLSSLVGTAKNFNEEFLRRSLKTILTYAEFDSEFQDTSFPEQVRDLVFNLHMILSDTVKMKEYQKDPEMLLDLMYRIAKGYQNSPDLRLTWLSNMAKKHFESENHMEAAMCLIHSAALVSEYLHMIEDRPYLPIGAVAFQMVSPNVLEESAVSDDVISPDEETICSGMYFSEAGLMGLLEHAANYFIQAGMYEVTNEVYKVLLPVVERQRNFKKIAQIHNKLFDAFTKIDQLHGKRVFGTYFRVGFYGSKFGDLDGEEFIYKEPTLTKLSEISSRLESFYSKCFGEDRLSIIKDSNPVSRDNLDTDKAYIQITYVEPYFDPWELRQRVTAFERNFNIKHFVFATPFTPDGKAHGELHEQYKRKTILSTANHFPYIKTRIQVVERRSLVLSPIEVAIEDIQKKTLELHCATQQDPADPKILQMVLQGCIGTTVNQGPMEVALVFLSDLKDGRKPPTRHQNKLRLCFKDFSKKCADALQKNKSLIGPDQKEYQKELQRNYHLFTDKLMPMITNYRIIGFSRSNRMDNSSVKTSPVI